jgi:hypothetical protein
MMIAMPINCVRLGRSRNINAASSTAAGPCAWINTPLTTALVSVKPAITSTSGSAVPNTPSTSRLPQIAHEAGGNRGRRVMSSRSVIRRPPQPSARQARKTGLMTPVSSFASTTPSPKTHAVALSDRNPRSRTPALAFFISARYSPSLA